MSKPVIAVDVDEVIFPYTPEFLKYYNANHGTNIKFEDVKKYYFIGDLYPDLSAGADIEFYVIEFIAWAINHDIGPFPEAVEALAKLEKVYDIAIITSRHPDLSELTKQWLKRHVPSTLKHVHFTRTVSEDLTKSEACKQLGATVLIDDHPDHVADCVTYGVRGLLFGDYAWNRDVELAPGVERVNDWGAVLEVLL